MMAQLIKCRSLTERRVTSPRDQRRFGLTHRESAGAMRVVLRTSRTRPPEWGVPETTTADFAVSARWLETLGPLLPGEPRWVVADIDGKPQVALHPRLLTIPPAEPRYDIAAILGGDILARSTPGCPGHARRRVAASCSTCAAARLCLPARRARRDRPRPAGLHPADRGHLRRTAGRPIRVVPLCP